jgi:transcriptional regulator with XRE-family HTH domain
MRNRLPRAMEILRTSGSIIADIRKTEGLSQSELAELTGLHPNSITNAERGVVDPSILLTSLIFLRLRCLGVAVNEEGFYPIPSPDARGGLPFPNLDICKAAMISEMGRRVVERRHALGLSIRDLAEESGVHPNTVWNFEKGLVAPSTSTTYGIYRALGVSRVVGTEEGIRFL